MSCIKTINKLSFAVIVFLSISNITNALQLQSPQPIVATGQMMPINTGIIPIQQGMTIQNGLPQTTQQPNLATIQYGQSSAILQNNMYGNNNTVNQQYNNNELYNKEGTRSCQAAYAQSNGSYILDLSDTYDIRWYGANIIQDFINKAKEKKYNFVYIDLCNTGIDVNSVAQWHQLLKQNNIQVTWNLSNNKSINDYIIYYLDLNNIKGLNISNTSVSANGISYLCTLLQSSVDSTIQFINICGLNIPNAKVLLYNAFMQHVALWKQKNNNQEYILYKIPIIDSYDDGNYLIANGLNTISTTGNNLINNTTSNLQQPLIQQPTQYSIPQQLNQTTTTGSTLLGQTLQSNFNQTSLQGNLGQTLQNNSMQLPGNQFALLSTSQQQIQPFATINTGLITGG